MQCEKHDACAKLLFCKSKPIVPFYVPVHIAVFIVYAP